MNWLDKKYSLLLSSHLEQFKQVKENINFRCPICLDSQKNKNKARGWILSTGDSARFYCHNCGSSMSFSDFLKTISPTLFYDYLRDRYSEKKKEETFVVLKSPKPEFTTNPFKSLKSVSQLDNNHPAKLYIGSRMIPSEMHYDLFYAPKFKSFVNSLIPDKFEDTKIDEGRIVIPLRDKDGIIGFQGRSLNPKSDIKYITIMLDESKPKMYGLDKVNINKVIFAFEGPIDAMFIPNSVASAGGKIELGLENLFNPDRVICVYDNEPRSIETVKKIENAIRNKYKVCIWPSYLKEKDINDMVLAGYTPNDLSDIIKNNTYQGLGANLMLSSWKRI